jgi:hypothetical protein
MIFRFHLGQDKVTGFCETCNNLHMLMLWRIGPLLGRNLEANNGKRPLPYNGAVNTPVQQYCSVNTFLLQREKRGVVYAVPAEEL